MSSWHYMRQAHAYHRLWRSGFVAAIGLMVVAFLLSLIPAVDLTVSSYFHELGGNPAWPASHHPVWRFLNRYAGAGTAVLVVTAVVLLVLGFFRPAWKRYRLHMIYIILVVALGPGFMVNGVLKQWWGRPRPRETAELGGWIPYRTLVQPDGPGRGRSFPCGHCAAAFSLVALYFVARNHPVLRRGALLAAAVAGSAMSLARIASGAHFFTDAIFSWGIVLFVAHGLYYFVFNIPARLDTRRPEALAPGTRTVATAFVVMLLVGLGGALATPYFDQIRFASRWHTDRGPADINVAMEVATVDLFFSDVDRYVMTGMIGGYRGLFGKIKYHWRQTDGIPAEITYQCRPVGFGVDLQTEVKFELPMANSGRVVFALKDGRLRLHDPVFTNFMSGQLRSVGAGAKVDRDGTKVD